jgi:hypothetical protein
MNEHSINPVGIFRIDPGDPEFEYRDELGRRPLVKIEFVDDDPVYFGNPVVHARRGEDGGLPWIVKIEDEPDPEKAFLRAKAAAERFMAVHCLTPVDPETLEEIRKSEEP